MRPTHAPPRLPRPLRTPRRQPPPASLAALHTALPPAVTDAASQLLAAVTGPHRDAAAAAVTAGGAYTLVKVASLVGSKGWADPKLTRKVVHTLAGPGYTLCWPLFSADPMARFYAAAVPAINMLRLLAVGLGAVQHEGSIKSMTREGDRRELLRGPLFYVVILQAATLAWWRTSPVPLLVVATMCGGDGVADIVGRRLPSPRLPWNPAKSVAGTTAMTAVGAGMGVGFVRLFAACGLFRVDPTAATTAAIAVAAVAALVESLPLPWLDDNLSVPTVSAALAAWLFQPV